LAVIGDCVRPAADHAVRALNAGLISAHETRMATAQLSALARSTDTPLTNIGLAALQPCIDMWERLARQAVTSRALWMSSLGDAAVHSMALADGLADLVAERDRAADEVALLLKREPGALVDADTNSPPAVAHKYAQSLARVVSEESAGVLEYVHDESVQAVHDAVREDLRMQRLLLDDLERLAGQLDAMLVPSALLSPPCAPGEILRSPLSAPAPPPT
jgi:hypothetical protein